MVCLPSAALSAPALVARKPLASLGLGLTAALREAAPRCWRRYGDEMARAAFLAAGEPILAARANTRRGGLFTIHRGGQRIQIIWKTLEGGNH